MKTHLSRAASFFKKTSPLLFVFILLSACSDSEKENSPDQVNWQKRMVDSPLSDSLENGVTHLSVYSQFYSKTEHTVYDLTATISMRNISPSDTIFIEKAEYFDTHGTPIRTYFDQPIFILPLETVQIVIDEVDQTGGTGANFLFDWRKKKNMADPLFESLMISTAGRQGISFICEGHRVK